MRASALAALLVCAMAAPTGYRLPDGSIAIVGYNDMSDIFAALNPIFARAHPEVRFHMQLKGTATAAPALTLGVSAFAPMGAEFSHMELAAYRACVGADPVPIRVAHCSLDPRALSAPIGIYVNRLNPIAALSTAQVARIFTARGITRWGQLGLRGEWAQRPTHPMGIAEEAAAGLSAFMLTKMGGGPYAPGYAGFAQSTQVVQRVAEDVAAIGFASANIAEPRTKLLPIESTNPGSSHYPYDRYLYVYIRRVPGEPLDPLVRDYLRMMLSPEGQSAIAHAPPHYVPLTADEVAQELARLDAPVEKSRSTARTGDYSARLLENLNALVAARHPDLASRLPRADLASLSLYGIITGVSPIALLDREAWSLEIRPFRQTYGYEPTAIRIGRAAAPSLSICVNARNPIAALTPDQAARVFTGRITAWGELGLGGKWAKRAIHPYGPRDNGGMASALRHAKMGGLPFARGYQPRSSTSEIAQALLRDPDGIALIESPPSSAKSLVVGDMLDTPIILYVNQAPGAPLDSFTQEYARVALSPEGQEIVHDRNYNH